VKNKKIFLNCELFSIDGKKKFIFNIDGKKNEAKKIGHKAGLNLISQAGDSYKVNK
jgi:porphobilinogen deaminase